MCFKDVGSSLRISGPAAVEREWLCSVQCHAQLLTANDAKQQLNAVLVQVFNQHAHNVVNDNAGQDLKVVQFQDQGQQVL